MFAITDSLGEWREPSVLMWLRCDFSRYLSPGVIHVIVDALCQDSKDLTKSCKEWLGWILSPGATSRGRPLFDSRGTGRTGTTAVE